MNQAIDDILNAFPKVEAVLQILVATGVVKSQSGIVISTLLGDVQAVISGAQQPSADLIGKVQQLLSDLTANNVLTGTTIDEVASGLGQFKSFVADVQNNQVAVIKTAELFGVPGMYAFIPNASDQGKSLGL